MALDYLSLWNYSQPSTSTGALSVSTITGQTATGFSTIVGNVLSTTTLSIPQVQVTSTMLSLGPNTQSTMVNASQGSYATGSWQTAKTGLANVKKLAMSSTGQYQLVVSRATSDLWLSSDSGVNWTALGASQGLPVLTGSAQWVAGAISASGQQITLAMQGGSLWFSSDYGRTFAVSPQSTPDVWLSLNGSTADLMGTSTVTATGSPGYVTMAQPGFSEQVIQLTNTAGGTATQYLRGTGAGLGSTAMTVSFWFNPQTISPSNGQATVFMSKLDQFGILFNTANNLFMYFPTSPSSWSSILTPFTLTANTWYYVTAIFQANGPCSFYVNNTLIGSGVNSGGVTSNSNLFSLGTYVGQLNWAFNGYIADFRLYNSVVPYVAVPHLAPAYWLPMEGSVADSGSYSITQSVTPFAYFPFNGSLVDSQGSTTLTATGSITYVTNVPSGSSNIQSVVLANTAGGTATNYLRGVWSGSPNFTVSFWFNPQTLNGTIQYLFSAYSSYFAIFVNSFNQLGVNLPSGGGSNYVTIGPSAVLTSNTWYFVTVIFQVNGLCSLYLNNVVVGSGATNTSGFGSLTTSVFELSGQDGNQSNAFNGYIDDFRLWNSAFTQAPHPTLAPTIYLPFEGSLGDSQNVSTVTATGAPTYTTSVYSGAIGSQAINLANTAGGTASNYVRGTWGGSANFTISFWVNPQTVSGARQNIFGAYNDFMLIFINTSNQLVFQFPTGSGITTTTIVRSTAVTANIWYYITAIFQSNGTCSFYVNNTLAGTFVNAGGFGDTASSNRFSLGCSDIQTNNAFNGYIDEFRIYHSAAALDPTSSIYPLIYMPLEGTVTDIQGSSAVTATGSPAYTTAVRVGATGTQAINLANTAGGTATKYIRGTWVGANNWTVSFWFNTQSLGARQLMWGSYNGWVSIEISTGNLVQFLVPNGSGSSVLVGSSSAISSNTWYYVYGIFQSNGLCSFYVNNSLIATYTNSGGVGSLTTTSFGLGTWDSLTSSAFNGYIDDFRLYNSAIPYVPVSIVAPFGTMAYVPGVVGQTALSLVNTTGGTAANYIRGGYSPIGTDVTLTMWVNIASLPSSGYQIITSILRGGIEFYIDNASRLIIARFPSGSTTNLLEIVFNSAMINTWYHLTLIFKMNGTCLFYVNGTLIGTRTNSGGYGTFTSIGLFGIGTYEDSAINAFNGYIDDFRLYNSAIPYHSLFPQNYTHLAMSGNGAYQMATNSIGRLSLSSDSGSTWTLQSAAATPGAWSSLSSSYSGKYLTAQSQPVVQPNQTGLVAATWSQQGITYTASASSVFGAGFQAYSAFDNTISGGTNRWASNGGYTSGTGLSTGSASTTIQGGIGTVNGEWIQLQVSTPLVLQSYSYATGSQISQIPKIYYIVGSNDGSTWFPIQYVNVSLNPFTTTYTALSNTILVNYSGTQTLRANIDTTATTTAYSTSIQPFLYFRMVINSIYSGFNTAEIAEWYPNFLGGSIVPNQSGLSAFSWSNSGVNWTASSSTNFLGSNFAWSAFTNNSSNVNTWGSAQIYNATTGAYTGTVSTNVQGGIGGLLGEWLQLQGSIPLVMQSYTYACWGVATLPKEYYILGSNDGSSWFPLQYVSMTTNPCTATFTQCSTQLLMNYTGTQAILGNQVGSGTTIAYAPYVTQAWTYFRIVVRALYASSTGVAEFNEFTPFFAAGQTSSSTFGSTWTPTLQTGIGTDTLVSDVISLSESGQYTLMSSNLPQFVHLTFNNTNLDSYGLLTPTTGAGSVTYSSSIVKVGTHSAFFNNVAGSTPTVNYLRYTLPSSFNYPASLTVSFWAYPTSFGSPVVLPVSLLNSTLATGGPSFFIRPSGSIVLSYSTTTTAYAELEPGVIASTNTWQHFAFTFNDGTIRMYINGNLSGTRTYTGLPSTNGGGPITNVIIGCSIPTGTYANSYAGYVDDVRIYTSALSATEISTLYLTPSVTHVISISSSYPPISSYSRTFLSGVTGNVVDTAVSHNGQFMVLVTSGTSNHVYYSLNYGATFTGLTLGSSAMVACSISYDGSYLTVTNAAGEIYRLNSNSTGFSLAVGSQAGRLNQARNAVAIGSQAGLMNQSGNSIVLNATGSAVNTGSAGFYVAPVASSASAATTTMGLLGYGEDKQIVQTGVTVQAGSGNVGIGTTNPQYQLQLSGSLYAPIDAIAQGAYLTPSVENRDIILAWISKVVNTVTPVTGVSPFWSTVPSYATLSAATGYGGCVLVPDGRVVLVPSDATTIGLFNPRTNTYSTVAGAPGGGAYAGGVLLPDGRVLFVPHNASTIGLFNPITNAYSTVAMSPSPGGTAYNGGVLLPDGRVVFVPVNSSVLGLFNPVTNTYSTVSGMPTWYAYSGGVLLPDGRVLFIPHNATVFGIFDYRTNTYSTVSGAPGSAAYGRGTLLPDGRVLLLPSYNNTFGLFDSITNTYRAISPGAAVGNGYAAAVLLPDGRVALVPGNSTTISFFHPTTNSFSTFGTAPGSGAYNGGLLLPDGRVFLAPGGAGVIGLLGSSVPAPREFCLHPIFNRT